MSVIMNGHVPSKDKHRRLIIRAFLNMVLSETFLFKSQASHDMKGLTTCG